MIVQICGRQGSHIDCPMPTPGTFNRHWQLQSLAWFQQKCALELSASGIAKQHRRNAEWSHITNSGSMAVSFKGSISVQRPGDCSIIYAEQTLEGHVREAEIV